MGKKENSKTKEEALKAIRKELRHLPSKNVSNQDMERQKVFWRRILDETKGTNFA